MLNEAPSRWFLFFRESRGVRSDACFFFWKDVDDFTHHT